MLMPQDHHQTSAAPKFDIASIYELLGLFGRFGVIGASKCFEVEWSSLPTIYARYSGIVLLPSTLAGAYRTLSTDNCLSGAVMDQLSASR